MIGVFRAIWVLLFGCDFFGATDNVLVDYNDNAGGVKKMNDMQEEIRFPDDSIITPDGALNFLDE